MLIMKIIGAVLVAFLLASSPASALYKWTDKNNVTHYDQFPPKNQKSQEIQIKPQKTPDKPQKNTPAKKPLSDNQTSQDKAKNTSTSTSTNTAAQDKNCAKARQNLQILSNNKRIRIKDNGNYRILPESERQQQINGLKDQINSTCQSAQKQSQQPR